MMRRGKTPKHINRERWLVSYADFVTLLFAFFVMLYANSQVDQAKVGRLSTAIHNAFEQLGVPSSPNPAPGAPSKLETGNQPYGRSEGLGQSTAHRESDASGPTANSPPSLESELRTKLAPELASGEVGLHLSRQGLVVSLREVGFFASGSARLKPGSRPAFDRIAALLTARGLPLRVEGHTDNVPVHSRLFDSNWELSAARAIEVARRLITNQGFQPDQLSIAGYAEFHPAASNQTAEGRAQNRRVDLVVLAREDWAIPEPPPPMD